MWCTDLYTQAKWEITSSHFTAVCVHLFIPTTEWQPVSYVKYVSTVTMKSSATMSSPVTIKSSVIMISSAKIWEILSNMPIPIMDHKLSCGFMIKGGGVITTISVCPEGVKTTFCYGTPNTGVIGREFSENISLAKGIHCTQYITGTWREIH